jgi:hypothetical protein
VDLIVHKTNIYVVQYIKSVILKHRSRVRNQIPVSQEEIYLTLGLMGIIQEPTYKSYFPKDAFLETSIFGQTGCGETGTYNRVFAFC